MSRAPSGCSAGRRSPGSFAAAHVLMASCHSPSDDPPSPMNDSATRSIRSSESRTPSPCRHRQRSDRERRRGGQHAPGEIAGVQILARHRRAGLAHLRAQDHRDRFLVVTHRERHAEVANHRRHHVAVPAAVFLPVGGAALQADCAGIDRFLSERAEALALERHLAPTDFAAHEELLEAIVDAARQAHALEHFAALVFRQRRFDRRPAHESIARLDDFGARLLQALQSPIVPGVVSAIPSGAATFSYSALASARRRRRPRGIELDRIAALDRRQARRFRMRRAHTATQTDAARRQRRQSGCRTRTICRRRSCEALTSIIG